MDVEIETLSEISPVTKTENLRPIGFYAQHVRKHLPQDVFEPVHYRLLWFAGFVAISAVCMLAISGQFGEMAWPIKLLAGITAGICFGGCGFFTHELLHGSVVRNKTLQDVIGFFGFMPFFISPTFWRMWHNQLHHGKTQSIVHDPDAFPTLKIFRYSKFMNFMFPFTPGSGHKRSATYLFFWFSFHVFVAQSYLRFRNSIFEKLNHKRVSFEFGGQILIWGTMLYLLGPENLFWTWVIPLFAQNYFAMSYIATNHNLSPLTRVNDPLVNSLTVTNHPVLEWIHLNFGYHVEHHIFPTISGVHSKKIHKILKAEFPNDFQYMYKAKAISLLYKTARVYKNTKILMNPETGATYPCISAQKPLPAPTSSLPN
jgi:fatty acid desaturase